MSAAARPPFGWKEALMLACTMVGPAAVVAGVIRSDGKSEALIEDTARRVVQLEVDGRAERERREADREAYRALAAQNAERLARIETLQMRGAAR
ncbi:hypothetical protein ASG37_04870 [Sphingomonas sp. Leaf407]|uniref:hypothetical protein n=1 Tax=unclassified Sphingomonas TaxID=196159 RepID=UPI0006F52BE9|nr:MULTISPECIES: hypothetical protein [unclassified Sphingomonas]KQN36998.1 hypothetical protein ASE97_10785 [Sphingomonas sp. Leaf42]KQT30425.1 hypothetical protein ASG37_04870 [Sphingomonas sp. Leaf407]